MECRIVRYRERHDVARLHAELVGARPEYSQVPFDTNPVPFDDDFPYLFYFIDGDDILGVRRAIPDVCYREGEEIAFAWCYDTVVNPDHHGKGIGTKLVAVQVEEFARRGQVSGAAFSAPAMMRIYDKLGYSVLGFAPKYAKVRNVAPFLHRKVRSGVIASLMAVPLNLAQKALELGRARSGFSIEQLNTGEFERFWNDISTKGARYHWDADARWVASRLGPNDETWAVRTAPNGKPSAVLVVRDRKRVENDADKVAVHRLTLMHYGLATEPDSMDALAAGLSKLLRTKNADVADIITTEPDANSALARQGFKRRGDGMTFVFKEPGATRLPQSGKLSDWKLTHFCSDGFLFP